MGDRIVILNQGIIQQVDKPSVIYQSPDNLFVAGFIGQMNFLKGTIHGNQLLLSDAHRLNLPTSLAQLAGDYEGKALILGVRPEHFHAPDGTTASEARLDILPEHLEALGSEQMVHFTIGDSKAVARLAPDIAVTLQQPLTLAIDFEKAHLFDPATEKRLTAKPVLV